MASDDGRWRITAGIQSSTAGALSYAGSGSDGLVLFTAVSSNFLGELLHVGCVAFVILLALNLCTAGVQVSLYALNSSVPSD